MIRILDFLRKLIIQFFRLKFLLSNSLRRKKTWNLGFLTDEFYHQDLMSTGGYGMTLKIVTDYFNNKPGPIKADILMCAEIYTQNVEQKKYNNTNVIFLPREKKPGVYFQCNRLIENNRINVLVGVDHYAFYEYYLKNFPYIPWIVWIKDPKDKIVWNNIASIPSEAKRWGADNLSDLVKYAENDAESLRRMIKFSRAYGRRIYFASESNSLTEIAKRQYSLENINAFNLPKPMPLPDINKPSFSEKPSFLFLARLDPIKRPWIYFELARKFQNATFYVAGEPSKADLMDPMVKEYQDIPNLKFLGIVSGKKKTDLLNSIWAVINTSIHEGIPVSVLEGFSFGKPAIAALNPDQIVSKFGIYVGEIFGEGNNAESVERFSDPIESIISGKFNKESLGIAARRHIADFHSFEYFEKSLKQALNSSSNFEYRT